MVDAVPPHDASAALSSMRKVIADTVKAMPTHQQFIDRYCRADFASPQPLAASGG
jgi:tryptophan halogenase